MPYVLDTCSLSEFVAAKPDPKVVERLTSLPRDEIHLCAITIGELEQGVSEMKPCDRKTFLRHWLESHVVPLYAPRTLPIEITVAVAWGKLNADLKRRGLKMPLKDALIAATALVHDLTVVTRNETDFANAGVRIFNPWN